MRVLGAQPLGEVQEQSSWPFFSEAAELYRFAG